MVGQFQRYPRNPYFCQGFCEGFTTSCIVLPPPARTDTRPIAPSGSSQIPSLQPVDQDYSYNGECHAVNLVNWPPQMMPPAGSQDTNTGQLFLRPPVY
ncbi:hypothetical protein GIB67_022715 [Kingdonia uniflora]|uniref:Uncharacterized protein n=1 Tax=Kingdonia uniflora TaxID=39325 RepID=A0A7J7P8Q8_9MAGN|nr:hypothetical protein GIB67_022715 [Kingdonia uniflora]